MLQPALILETPFVDREKESSNLRGLFAKTRAGNGCTILLVGEAGVGKTRLVKEFSREVKSAGSMFLEGSSFEHEGTIPYSPWVDIVQDSLKKISPAAFRKIPEWVVSEIGALVPQILSQARELGLKAWLKGPRAMSTLLPSTDQDKIRLFQALSELLDLIDDKGVVIFMDDLVWADPLSLQMFHHLSRRTGERRMMLIGAYRDVDVDEDHPLAIMARDLARRHISQQMTLGRFTEDHVSALLTKQLEGPVSRELSNLIYTRTGGNPFFVEEIVRSLVEQGLLTRSSGEWTVRGIQQVEIPSSVRTVIRQRTSRLSDDCVQLLSLASLVGMEFDFDVLRQASGMPEETVLALLESAVKARLVQEKKVGSRVVYYFADEQVSDFFSEQLGLLRARKYHEAIGRAMEEAYGSRIEDRLGELAYHYVEAAATDKAKEYSIRAGDRSARLHAHSDARRHWTNALELTPETSLEERLELMTKLARSAYSEAKVSDTLQLCGKAIETARRLEARTKIAGLYGLQGLAYFLLEGSKENALECYQKGLEALKAEPETRQEAVLLQETARIYALTGAPDLGMQELQRAIGISSKIGAYDVLAQCYLTMAIALPVRRKEETFSYQSKALSLGEEHDIPEAVMRACNNLGVNYGWMKADYARAEELLLKGLGIAEKLGAVDYLIFVRAGLAWEVYLPWGQWEKAEKAAHDTIQLATDFSEITGRYLVEPFNTLSVMLTARREFEKAQEYSNQAVSMAEKIGWSDAQANSHYVRGVLYFAKGMLGQAELDFSAALEFAKQTSFEASMINSLFMLVLVSLKKGMVQQAASLYEELCSVVNGLDENWAYACAKWADGLIAETRGDMAGGLSCLGECVDRWKKVERPYELARAYKDLARVQERAGKKAEAVESLSAAGKIFSQLKIPV